MPRKPVVLLTDPIDPGETERLRRAADVRLLTDGGALAREMAAADIVVVRRSIPEAAIAAAPRLRALIRHGAGLDFIPVEAASAAGIAVVNTPDTNAVSVAEHVFGMILALRRAIAANDRGIREGEWQGLRAGALRSREISGSTLGLVGFGSIGQAVGRIAAEGFGMTVLAARRRAAGGPDWVRFLSLDEMIPAADILVLACPLTPETAGLLSAERIGAMRPGSLLVNIARGPVADETALAAALAEGRIGGAALDVFAAQPLRESSPLREAPNTLLSPHVAGLTVESMRRMSAAAVEDALRVLDGQRPRHLVNDRAWPEIAERWRRFEAEPDTSR
ncbi:NAD(P)-dependent oxidoreductase [Paralimibaculum aggregatum]|uniref:NAD(P)-dependent oxidoreductase n=1 Tax=Paralimibaculum aggregatum TaxID=3036245 RepID=A0ABQ6LM36_9RHOB|nr:NAD(P)-dependent oxidoreductase [Limibaculum sp. NKW23]GMG84274.1 NAD(P)-dependent oxidoreductase [Limibaculum sp. NKW23]